MKNFKKVFAFTGLVKPFAQIWTRAMTWQSGCTRNLRKPSFANAHSYGFTLAEVLITLSILGVVVAITVPSLINRNTINGYKTKTLKAINYGTQVLEEAIAEQGSLTPGELYSHFYDNDCKNIGRYFKVSGNVTKNGSYCNFKTPDGVEWSLGASPSGYLYLYFRVSEDKCTPMGNTNPLDCNTYFYDGKYGSYSSYAGEIIVSMNDKIGLVVNSVIKKNMAPYNEQYCRDWQGSSFVGWKMGNCSYED